MTVSSTDPPRFACLGIMTAPQQLDYAHVLPVWPSRHGSPDRARLNCWMGSRPAVMDRIRLSALLVPEDGQIRGIVERDHLANTLLLSLIEHASRQA